MLSVTFDTSCCLNLYRGDASPDPAVVGLMRLGLRRRLDIHVSEVASQEVSAAADINQRRIGMDRMEMFPTLTLPPHLIEEAEALTVVLNTALFPGSDPRTRQSQHNVRDCRHLAIHRLMGRAVFVTLDIKLWRKRAAAATHGITILRPAEVMAQIASERAVAPVEATVAARLYQPEDEPDVRRVLSSLAADYPNFDGWITRTLGDDRTSVLVGTLDGRVAGVVIWKPRGDDHRAVKLSSFRIDEWAQDSGLGSHMLFHALRAWVAAGYTVAHVTVSSKRADLVGFFATAGFLIQGTAPLRYADDASEIVLGKLMLREQVGPDEIHGLAERLSRFVFGRPGGPEQAAAADRLWLLPPMAGFPKHAADRDRGNIRLVDDVSDATVRELTAFDLETLFYPLRIAVAGREAVLVPIRPDWADRMLTYAGKQQGLFDPVADPLLIRAENAYYCFPRCLPQVEQKCRILFYVTSPVSALVGEAIITECVVDYPEVLHQLFGDLGIYTVTQIAEHVARSGPREGLALALRFAFYLPFDRPVSLRQLRRTVGSPKFSPQGLHPVDIDTYLALRSAGGLAW